MLAWSFYLKCPHTYRDMPAFCSRSSVVAYVRHPLLLSGSAHGDQFTSLSVRSSATEVFCATSLVGLSELSAWVTARWSSRRRLSLPRICEMPTLAGARSKSRITFGILHEHRTQECNVPPKSQDMAFWRRWNLTILGLYCAISGTRVVWCGGEV